MMKINTLERAIAAGFLPDTWDEELRRPRCLARSKQQARRCKQWPLRGKRVCHYHGGRAGRPVKHGRYSKLLPSRLADRYRQSILDPDYLKLRDEIALLDARVCELLDQLKSGGGGNWHRLLEGIEQVRLAIHNQNAKLMRAALESIEAESRAKAKEQAIWDEVVQLLEQRRKLVDTERRRVVDAQQMVTLEQMMALLAVVQDVVLRYVDDGPTRARIADEFRNLAAGHALPPPPGGQG